MSEGPFDSRLQRITGDGLELATWEAGDPDAPPVVLVHGFPDTHAVWLPVMERLAETLRCVGYDVRGAGESGVPDAQEGYRVSHMVSDLVAVIDAVSPGRPVHLVAHDWGSVQTWEAVLLAGSDPRLRGRVASYTTISGPALSHYALWARHGLTGSWRQRAAVVRQLAHSWYILGFQLPRLPELALRWMLASPQRTRRLLGSRPAAPTVVQDAVNGLGLYRANLRGAAGPRHSLRTELPVQLIVPTRDPFLTPAVYDDLPRYCADLTRHDVDAGHWVQQSHPDDVARLVADFVLAHEATPKDGAQQRNEAVEQFVDDDEGYLGWLAVNPEGHVVNTPRHPNPSSVVLHRATCHTISGDPARGASWTHDYVKVCGSREDLERWAVDEVGGPVHPCGLCLRPAGH